MPAVESHVTYDILYITFRRPAQLNALRWPTSARSPRPVAHPADQVRALVFTGAVTRSFSAGLHLDTFADLGPASARRVIGQVRDCLAAVRTTRLPTAAMIGGYCLGAAFELALACDLRVATDDAQFGLPGVRVGITRPGGPAGAARTRRTRPLRRGTRPATASGTRQRPPGPGGRTPPVRRPGPNSAS
jgi:enoyl-CoA hydratase